MSRPSFLQYGMRIAHAVAARATCERAYVGCVLFDEKKRILATGYNGPPKGFDHCSMDCKGMSDWSNDDCPATHAEINALIQCSKPDNVYYVFCTVMPCFRCAKALLNTGMKELYYEEEHRDKAKVLDLLKQGDITHELLR